MSLKPNHHRSKPSSNAESVTDVTSFACTPKKPLSKKTPNITAVNVSVNQQKSMPFQNETVLNSNNQNTMISNQFLQRNYLYAINAGLSISFASWIAFFAIHGTLSTHFFPWSDNFSDHHAYIVKSFVYLVTITLFI